MMNAAAFNCKPIIATKAPVPDIVKDWRPKTKTGRLVKAGSFSDYFVLRENNFAVKEPEIADYFFGADLEVAPLKIMPIGDGQYRYKAFVAVGDGKSSIGFGQSCSRDRESAETAAARNAKLNIMRLKKNVDKASNRST